MDLDDGMTKEVTNQFATNQGALAARSAISARGMIVVFYSR